jgi:hypothetical protein
VGSLLCFHQRSIDEMRSDAVHILRGVIAAAAMLSVFARAEERLHEQA